MNGLCVVKKLVVCTIDQELRERLMAKIADHVIDLVQNPFGNYAISELLNNWDLDVCRPIFHKIRSRISQLSIQKFSSNVIEKCLEKADEELRKLYIEEICQNEKLSGLIRNSYGNYVVQKALKIATGDDRKNIISSINHHIPNIPDKKIRSKWEKIIEGADTDQEEN